MNFCTLFDSAYLLHALAMYRSLERHTERFHLYIYAFDDEVAYILNKLGLEHATVVPLVSFETDELRTAKNGRTKTEYFWTCTPSVIHHAITTFGLESCTYLDADLLFFSSPAPLLDEAAGNSVLIVPHRYHPEHDKTDKVGKYCVQFNMFRNEENGMRALTWWRDRCLEWCHAREEEGKFGDQKYLDDWPERFAGVHELSHIGGGVAPWNVLRYNLIGEIYSGITVSDKLTDRTDPLVFYHFQHTALFDVRGSIRTKSYPALNMNRRLYEIFYGPYEVALNNAWNEVREVVPAYRPPFNKTGDYLFEELREHVPSVFKRTLKRLIPGMNRKGARLIDHST